MKRHALVAVAAAAALAGCGLPATSGTAAGTGASSTPPYSVTLTSCAAEDPITPTFWTSNMAVVNTSSRVRSFYVTISVNDESGNRVGELNGSASALAPGQSATVKAVGMVPVSVPGRCEIARVTTL